MNKIHVVEFTSGTTAKTITGLFQWNHGQILQIKGLNLPTAVEVHFALRRSGEAIPRIGVTKDGVTEVEIPDVLFKTMMTSDYDIYAYVYVSDEEYGSTTHEIVMKVKSRPMPEDIQNNFDELMKAVNALADGKVDKNQGTENNGKFLGVVDGYVALMDAPSGGTANAVQYVAQELTEEQQEQARANIGAANVTYDTETKTLNICLGGGTTNGLIEQIEDYIIENEIEKIVIDGVEVNLSRYAKKEETDRLSQEIVDYNIEPKTDDIPKIFIDGVIPTTKDDVLAVLKYISKTDEFEAYLKIKCQGTSSMNYPKKNFTIKLYSDEERETKLKKLFKDWLFEQNKYVLKANYIDHSHARNIICARLWDEVVASRSDYNSLPEELRTSPRNGAIDGFPVKVYTNGTYQGIYTWNIGKDAWMWNMDEDNTNHVLLCAETNTNDTYTETPCNFRALWNGVHENHWSVEVGTNSTAVKDSLNALITCVKDTDDATFKATIGNYLDIQSAIDYYIHQYVICGIDGLAKNMLLGTYDLVKWYCGAYDMDSVLGLYWDGKSFVPSNHACPEDYQEKHSLLFERIEKLFFNELRARYIELRKTVYSFGNMCTHFERFMDVIGSELYAEDLTIYNGIPSGNTNNIKQIRDYIRDRLAYCDTEFGNMKEPISATSISLDKTVLSFTEATNQVLVATVEPSDSTDKIVWTSSNDGIAKVVNGVVTPITNGSCTITATAGSVSATCEVEVNMETTPYLQNDGVAYIDLGINSRDGYSYEICLKDENILPTTGAGEHIYFGNRFNYLKHAGQTYIAWNLKNQYNGLNSVIDDKKHVYKVDANNLYLDGVIDGTANWGTSTNHPSMVLFGANFINGGSGFYLASLTKVIKFYYLKIWNSDNELIHSYVPALKDGVACVLDEVTNEYLYNSAESGGFTYGEE